MHIYTMSASRSHQLIPAVWSHLERSDKSLCIIDVLSWTPRITPSLPQLRATFSSGRLLIAPSAVQHSGASRATQLPAKARTCISTFLCRSLSRTFSSRTTSGSVPSIFQQLFVPHLEGEEGAAFVAPLPHHELQRLAVKVCRQIEPVNHQQMTEECRNR